MAEEQQPMAKNDMAPDLGAGNPTPENVIEIRGMRTQFGRQLVHENLDLDIHKGEILGLVGGSGTGKSVMLRSMIGLQEPADGIVRAFGTDIYHATKAEKEALQRRWGVAFQNGALFSSLTVRENVEAPMREHMKNLTPDVRAELAELKIAMVGLAPGTGDKLPSQLSGGMRKLASLARALALDPELVLLDEPTAGLDPLSASAYDELIVDLQRSLGLTVLMVTHDLDSLATITDRVAVLAEKRVYVTGTVQDMLNVDQPWIKEYFHSPRARNAIHGSAGKRS